MQIQYISVPMILVCVGAILSVIGTFWATYDQAKGERELKEKTEEIARLNAELAATVTGGNAFPSITVVSSKGSIPDNPNLIVSNDGKYPLYDVAIRIVDLDVFHEKVEANPESTIEDVFAAQFTASLGNIAPNQIAHVGRLQLPKEKDLKGYNFFISARNGAVTQEFRFRRVGGTWRAATRISKEDLNGSRVILREAIDNGFPRNAEGSVTWQYEAP